MKPHHHLRHSVLTHLAVVAGLSLLTSGPGWQSSIASAAPKPEPVYSDIPGVTAPGQPAPSPAAETAPVTNQAPPPIVAPTTPAPVVISPRAPAPVEDDTKNKTLYGFQATDLDLRAALATFAKANNLNIIPDNDVVGTVTM